MKFTPNALKGFKAAASHSSFPWFLGFVASYWLLAFLFARFIRTDAIYFQSLQDQLSVERMSNLVSDQKKWEWLGYLLLPFALLIKILFVAGCLFISSFLSNMEIAWRKLIRLATLSETIFLIAGLCRFTWLLYFPPSDLASLNNSAPLSLGQLLPFTPPAYLQYAFQVINVFEICYWLVLAGGLRLLTGKSPGFCLGIVARGYGTGLLLWVLFVTFILIQFS